jgi:peptidyl-prolyl cis-trans isomerase C
METPDGKVFEKGKVAKPKAVKAARPARVRKSMSGRAASVLLNVFGIAAMAVLRAIGKFIITTWRLASALDSALWRATKLLAGRFADAFLRSLSLAWQVVQSLILWLPTRTGRAYSAVSGIALVISGLWIADELRAGSREAEAAGSALRAPVDEEDPILARIEGRYVHLSEIETAARGNGQIGGGEKLTPALAFQRGLVEGYVEQRLLARAAQETGLHRSPGVLRRVNAARDQILAAALIQSRLNKDVTPEKVERFYREQRKIMEIGDEVRARHILVESGEEAEEIVALLAGGADFARLARERSLDRSTAPLGGEIGWFSRAMMERRFARAAFSTPVGELSAPFQTEFGWHVLEVRGRRPTNAKPFVEVREDIEEFLRLEVIADTLQELEDESRVVYYRPDIEAEAPSVAPLILPGEPGADFTEVDAEIGN